MACGAGELVEETSDLTGGSWTTSAHYLRAGGGCSSLLIRRNSEYHCFDLTGTAGVILDGGSNALSDNLYDAYGVNMYSSGKSMKPYRVPEGKLDRDSLVYTKGCGHFRVAAVKLNVMDGIPINRIYPELPAKHVFKTVTLNTFLVLQKAFSS